MSDVTRPPADGTSADRGRNTIPGARGETAPGTAPPTPREDTSGTGTARVRGAGGTTAADTGAGAGDRPPGTPAGEAAGTRESERTGTRLLPHEERDRLAARLQHTVAGFVDEPRAAVEEADRVLEELTARFTEAVTQHRRTLRRSWQPADGGSGPAGTADTEQLRLALRDYRELAERLLHV
ncbi:hypothetical protein [Streptomyces sp. NPDC052701]|uniref:hypothetical protein n=1 Tax=Streptomyces sp. NPDC052701 TaxID=3155533 RepID=UPI00342E9256